MKEDKVLSLLSRSSSGVCGNQVKCRGVLGPAHAHSHLLRRADCASASLPNSLLSDVTLIVSINHDEHIYVNQDFFPQRAGYQHPTDYAYH